MQTPTIHVTINFAEGAPPSVEIEPAPRPDVATPPAPASAAAPRAALVPPALGEVWPGMGGIYVGTMPSMAPGEPARYLIASVDDREGLKWGGYDSDADAKNHWHGASNTAGLLSDDEQHPAAEWAAGYTADGHKDFHLPSRFELLLAFMFAPGVFQKAGWYWSSTQLSRNYAFVQAFESGTSLWHGKDDEYRVRAFRWIPFDASTLDRFDGPATPAQPVREIFSEAAKREPTLPAFGELVPGAGGRLGGIVRGALVDGVRQPDFAIIVPEDAAADLGRMPWGEYGKDVPGANSLTDGLANTIAMADAGCACALKVRALTIGDHNDFYIPSRAELWAVRGNVPELFAKEWHWSSTQYSRYIAFVQDFEGGNSNWGLKDDEYRVRAFRRIPLQHFDA